MSPAGTDRPAPGTAAPRSAAPAKAAKKAKGTVSIKPEWCKGCGFCIDFCPTHVLAFSREFNAKGYHYPEMAKPEECSGCDLCGLYCPDFAIYATKFKDGSES